MTTDLNAIQVRTPADLHEMWRVIMGAGGTARRSLWVALLNDDGWPRPVVIPIDDMPLDLDDELAAGLHRNLDGLRQFGEPVLLLARPGPLHMTDRDRRWARMLAPMTRWPVHLYTTAGVSVFAPDDLVPEA